MATKVREKPILFSDSLRWIKAAATRIGVSASEYADALNRGEKFCGGCLRSLPRSPANYGTQSRTFDGLRSKCKTCVAEVRRKHYHSNREAILTAHRVYRKENRERVNEYNVAWNKNRSRRLRADMIAAYGGKCECCGEDEPLFLELDHRFNDGASHRKQFGNQTQIMLYLYSLGWPRDRYQLLCSNCNQGKQRNGGICPHKSKKNQS